MPVTASAKLCLKASASTLAVGMPSSYKPHTHTHSQQHLHNVYVMLNVLEKPHAARTPASMACSCSPHTASTMTGMRQSRITVVLPSKSSNFGCIAGIRGSVTSLLQLSHQLIGYTIVTFACHFNNHSVCMSTTCTAQLQAIVIKTNSTKSSTRHSYLADPSPPLSPFQSP
jgi:hypothetical protein